MNRKGFIRRSSLALAGMAIAGKGLSFTKPVDKLRVGIIGTGDRGTGLASEIDAMDDLVVVAGCDILPFRLDKFRSMVKNDVSTYTDYRKLLDNRAVDAVIIASPLYLHKQMVFDAVDAGKHIYCEKTMAYNIPQTLELVKKVKSSRKVFQVGHQYRNYPLYSTVYDKIRTGSIGEVRNFSCNYNLNTTMRRPVPDPKFERTVNWRLYREYSGGIVAELSSHQIDAMNYLLNGHPLKVTGFGSINHLKDGREVYDNINIVAEYPGQITGTFTCRLSNAHDTYVIKVHGTKGTIEIHRNEAFYYAESRMGTAVGGSTPEVIDGVSGATRNAEPGKAYQIDVDLKRGYDATTYALLDFVDCIRNSRTPASNIETGRMAAIAVDMANMAMEKGEVQYWKPAYDT